MKLLHWLKQIVTEARCWASCHHEWGLPELHHHAGYGVAFIRCKKCSKEEIYTYHY